jgi:hypothetical protein
MLLASQDDIITAEYEYHTLLSPHTTVDELDISATLIIGNIMPSIQTVSVDNTRMSDSFVCSK